MLGATSSCRPLIRALTRSRLRPLGLEQRGNGWITLEVAESKVLTLALKMGNVQETVEVAGTPPELNESNADRSLIIEPAFVETLPLNIRNPLQLIDFAPGVTKGDDGLSGQDATSESRTNTVSVRPNAWMRSLRPRLQE